jgi:Protein of unknown function (DUF992)
MSKRPISGAIGASVFALGLLAAGPAFAAKSGINVGTLKCVVAPGVGLILGSSKGMDCTFHRANGRVEHYTGRVTKLGIDVGVTGKSYIAWAVFAPGSVKRGSLAGGYAGASAEATAGVGLGANVLVGGFDHSVTLQPLSIQGQTGLNVAAGITSMTLKRG